MAGRPKGTPKTGGRKKGSRNKATAPVREAIAAQDPIGKLFDLYAIANEEGNHELAQRTLATVLPYAYPKLAASQVDLRAAMQGDLSIQFEKDEE